jgi:hypothetical protein
MLEKRKMGGALQLLKMKQREEGRRLGGGVRSMISSSLTCVVWRAWSVVAKSRAWRCRAEEVGG